MLVAIDPGLQGTGVAVWKTVPRPRVRGATATGLAPSAVQVLTCRTSEDWWLRSKHLSYMVREMVGPLRTHDWVVCEFPEYQESTGRVMGWRKGDLQKLTFLTGVLAATLTPAQFQPVVPSRWKGQLPKTVVEERIIRLLGAATCRRLGIKTHAWDAVGIGLWAIQEEGLCE